MKFTTVNSDTLRRRAGAYFCDQAIIWLGHSILYTVFVQTFMPTLQYFPWTAQDRVFEVLTDSSSTTFIMCFLTYYMVAPWLGDGQTIGQRLFGVAIAIKQKENHVATTPPYLEILSYILRGLDLLLIQMTFGIPFVFHLFTKDGRGLQDWCSFSKVGLSEKRPYFSVIYADHIVSHHHEQELFPINQLTREVQLTLPLDFKNPSIVQLHQPSLKKVA